MRVAGKPGLKEACDQLRPMLIPLMEAGARKVIGHHFASQITWAIRDGQDPDGIYRDVLSTYQPSPEEDHELFFAAVYIFICIRHEKEGGE